jgi:hypothetical protein
MRARCRPDMAELARVHPQLQEARGQLRLRPHDMQLEQRGGYASGASPSPAALALSLSSGSSALPGRRGGEHGSKQYRFASSLRLASCTSPVQTLGHCSPCALALNQDQRLSVESRPVRLLGYHHDPKTCVFLPRSPPAFASQQWAGAARCGALTGSVPPGVRTWGTTRGPPSSWPRARPTAPSRASRHASRTAPGPRATWPV